MRTGFPVMKTGFSMLGIGLQGVPCKLYSVGFAVCVERDVRGTKCNKSIGCLEFYLLKSDYFEYIARFYCYHHHTYLAANEKTGLFLVVK